MLSSPTSTPADRQHPQHLAALAALPAGDDRYRVASSHMGVLHQMTSGASEMILGELALAQLARHRSEDAACPPDSRRLDQDHRVASKRMYDPSRRRTSFTVRTTTAGPPRPSFSRSRPAWPP